MRRLPCRAQGGEQPSSPLFGSVGPDRQRWQADREVKVGIIDRTRIHTEDMMSFRPLRELKNRLLVLFRRGTLQDEFDVEMELEQHVVSFVFSPAFSGA